MLNSLRTANRFYRKRPARRPSRSELPIDAESGAVRGSLVPLTRLEHGDHYAEFAPDGESFLSETPGASTFQDYRTGARKPLPEARDLSTDGLFVLRVSERTAGTTPGISKVLNLQTGESWGRIQTDGVPWDLSRGGQWVLAASTAVHRTIVAWDTRTAEHQAIYSHPTANLYLANFSKDGRWALFTSEEAGRQPRMWAAPFRGLQSVPVTEWIDLEKAIIRAGLPPAAASTSRKCMTGSSAFSRAAWIPPPSGPWVR